MVYLFLDPADREFPSSRNGRLAARYAQEILARLCLPLCALDHASLAASLRPPGILLLPYDVQFSAEELGNVAAFVTEGGALIALGGTSGLDEVLGARAAHSISEGYLSVEDRHSPLAVSSRQPLHHFGGVALEPADGAMVVYTTSDQPGKATRAAAIVVRRVGRGRTVTIGVDLLQSILLIQQGRPVQADGAPAPDGTAPIDDGILKVEDGMVLDWANDRRLPVGSGPLPDPFPHQWPAESAAPFFAEPVADGLRELLLRAIFWCAAETGVSLPWLWYWPGTVPAVAHLSLDSDNNLDEEALSALNALAEAGVAATWCLICPGSYSRPVIDRALSAGHEMGLHYNAHQNEAWCRWGQEHLSCQHQHFRQSTGLPRAVTNKNHFTRWEGYLDFYYWCEAEGIEVEESRGPSKQGDVGFPFGTCHPWFPYDDQQDRFIDVLALTLQTQDLWLTTPAANGEAFIAAALRHHGIAHLLFHPTHIHARPHVRQAMLAAVNLAREHGLEWWTAREINEWERGRRGVDLTLAHLAGGSYILTVRSVRPMTDVNVLLGLPPSYVALLPGGERRPLQPFSCYGQVFASLSLSLAAGEELRCRIQA